MRDRPLRFGIAGSVFVAVCCFTPFLPIALGAVGLSGLLGYVYRDAVLLPVLGGFLAVTGYALWRRNRST